MTEQSSAARPRAQADSAPDSVSWRRLWMFAAVQAVLYVGLALLSRRFDDVRFFQQRPILEAIGLLAAGFVLHLLSIRVALRLPGGARIKSLILVSALVFRAVLLPSKAIQEVDIYRYLWDGASVAAGASPYRYSPRQVSQATGDPHEPAELKRLVQARDGSSALAEALGRIHYAELTTVYPPAAQVVFALASVLSPPAASLHDRVMLMKLIFLLFDMATLLLVIELLRMTRRHPAWSILYGWSPLVLKEFANSGHFDAVAACLTTASVVCWIAGLRSADEPRGRLRDEEAVSCWRRSGAGGLAGLLLGLATGVKLYPAILLPLMVTVLAAQGRRGAAVLCGVTCLLSGGLILLPMVVVDPSVAGQRAARDAGSEVQADEVASTVALSTPPSTSGLQAFFSRWEMNDLPFMFLVENLRAGEVAGDGPTPAPWFVIVPRAWRARISDLLSERLGVTAADATFAVARAATLLVFLVVAVVLAGRAALSGSRQEWLRAVLLTIAWFWALAPTMNPWYWTWAMPFLPFARSRAWLAVSGLLLLYYLRFWLAYHYPQTPLCGTSYAGESFFHFVVVPLEHGVWLGWLGWEWLATRLEAANVVHFTDRPQ